MSWGLTVDIENGDLTEDSEKRVSELAAQENVILEAKEQIGVAIMLLVTAISSTVVGPQDGKFRVIMSGHANRGHVPASGWANDALSVSIHQM